MKETEAEKKRQKEKGVFFSHTNIACPALVSSQNLIRQV
jgi:hypothetical protein